MCSCSFNETTPHHQLMGLTHPLTHTNTLKHHPLLRRAYVMSRCPRLPSGWFVPSGYGSTLLDVFAPPDHGPILLLLTLLSIFTPHTQPPPPCMPHPPHPRPSACKSPLVFLTSSCSSSAPRPLFILSCPYDLHSQTEERLRPRRAATDLPAPHLHHHQWQQPSG